MTKRDLSFAPLPPLIATAPPPLPPVQVNRQSGLPEPPLPKSAGLVIEPYVVLVAAPASTPPMPAYEPEAKNDPAAAGAAPGALFNVRPIGEAFWPPVPVGEVT